MDKERQHREVDRNYDAFQRRLSDYLIDHEDEYALMRDGEVVAFFATVGEASRSGHERFADDVYSVQEVTARPIDLGIFSHAGS